MAKSLHSLDELDGSLFVSRSPGDASAHRPQQQAQRSHITAQTAHKQSNAESTSQETETSKLEKRYSELQSAIHKARNRLADEHAAIQSLHDKTRQAKHDYALAEKQLAELRAKTEVASSHLPAARLSEIEDKERKADTLLREAVDLETAARKTNMEAVATKTSAKLLEAELLKKQDELRQQPEKDSKDIQERAEIIAGRENALLEKETLFNKRLADLNMRDRQIARLEGRFKGKTSELAYAQKAYRKIKSENSRLVKQIKALTAENTSLNEKLIQQTQDISDLNDSVVAAAGAFFHGNAVVDEWLADLDERGTGPSWEEELATCGDGPLPICLLDEYLGEFDHTCPPAGCETAEVLIVGRNNWTEEEIESQIEAREGLSLRVYSQEMAIIALVTGHDPYDADQSVLEAFGQGHPALEYLMNRGFEWPTYGAGNGDDFDIDIADGEWHANSPLTSMGYHVGDKGLMDKERKALLRKIFQGRIKFPADFSPAERDEWGSPQSPARLEKMAARLAKNITLHGGRLGYDSLAVKEWKKDLAWLRKQFYGAKMRFSWPNIDV